MDKRIEIPYGILYPNDVKSVRLFPRTVSRVVEDLSDYRSSTLYYDLTVDIGKFDDERPKHLRDRIVRLTESQFDDFNNMMERSHDGSFTYDGERFNFEVSQWFKDPEVVELPKMKYPLFFGKFGAMLSDFKILLTQLRMVVQDLRYRPQKVDVDFKNRSYHVLREKHLDLREKYNSMAGDLSRLEGKLANHKQRLNSQFINYERKATADAKLISELQIMIANRDEDVLREAERIKARIRHEESTNGNT